MGLSPRSGRSASPMRSRACGSADVADKRVATFSRGMRQRLGLAEIIDEAAEIAILDEPTSGLDPQSTHEFLDMIARPQARRRHRAAHPRICSTRCSGCATASRCSRRGRIVLMGTVPELARQVLGAGFVVEVEADRARAGPRAAARRHSRA